MDALLAGIKREAEDWQRRVDAERATSDALRRELDEARAAQPPPTEEVAALRRENRELREKLEAQGRRMKLLQKTYKTQTVDIAARRRVAVPRLADIPRPGRGAAAAATSRGRG